MSVFQFKHFQVQQKHAALKVGTDSMILGSVCHWENPKRLLDIGTGTGILSLMCAQRFNFHEIIGLEISEYAVLDAHFNAQNSPFQSPISIINQPIQQYFPKEPFDAIISNPPFFENSQKNPDEHKSLARHTESLSFPDLIRSISRLLTKTGKAWIIIPFESTESIQRLAEENNLFISELITLFGKPDKPVRMIVSLIKYPLEAQFSSLHIRTENGSYTEEYKALTREFHDRVL
ncbi:tRNA1(Val) (adenine(37)-N6)-methyltransferase [Fluviicola chungangensis]|uniref:tRNA1(Val) (adenine(37)-N6)-methyltransferase n=1 Tax=Fluviicola chungangensis TaxID=2597671 RepID=A0A556N7J5_9FLAO|nr:methyltransferase [Fluviicola chungangensis]TSJ48108.1 methyltransferase [Fluviicola chungangensis]